MFKHALSAELLKYRRTPALLLALGVPLLLGVLMILAFTLGGLRDLSIINKWAALKSQLYSLWTVLVLPLGTAILATMAVGLEHADNHLKHVLALPPSRGAVYLAKLICILGLVLAGSLLLALTYLAVGKVLGFPSLLPWSWAFSTPLVAFVADLPVLTLALWLALRWRSFALPLGIGLAGTVAGSLAGQSHHYWPYVLWTYPFRATASGAHDLDMAVELALALGLVIALSSYVDFRRRDIL